MVDKKRSKFGALLLQYRRNCVDPERGGSLTQDRFAEMLDVLAGLPGYTGVRVSNWEWGKEVVPHRDRDLLLGIINVLYVCKGIQTAEQAESLLFAGTYRSLDKDEVQKINPDWSVETPGRGEIPGAEGIDSKLGEQDHQSERQPLFLGNIPPRPTLVIGRQGDLDYLKERVGLGESKKSLLTIVRGWPGVGKSTTVTTLAYDPDVGKAFPDGVLWAALGENPNVFSELAAWGRALGVDDIGRVSTIEEAMSRLRTILRHKRMLLIVDDVWVTEHGVPFKIGGAECVTIMTTRFQDVARALADVPSDEVFNLPVLSDDKALELLQTLTPTTVEDHPEDSKVLVKELEGLPLALQVAGRLLKEEQDMGWGVADLIIELREGAKLLEATAPADRADIANQTTPTVAALLKKSTDTLDEEIHTRFAYLGAFAPKPATFDLLAMAAVWEVDDARPTVRILVNRGLLEPVVERYQMHALLVVHARSLFED